MPVPGGSFHLESGEWRSNQLSPGAVQGHLQIAQVAGLGQEIDDVQMDGFTGRVQVAVGEAAVIGVQKHRGSSLVECGMAPWGVVTAPAVGAVLMSVSTIVVALNAQLLRRVAL